MATSVIPKSFLDRAWREAERYGDDSWVFLRELVQNARDANATKIAFSTEILDGRECLTCEDDGDGMTAAVVSTHLLRLFSSSKDESSAIGRFGVGFWSTLRFTPKEIEIDTATDVDGASLVIDPVEGALHTRDKRRRHRGTSVRLSRAPTGLTAGQLKRTVVDRLKHYAGPIKGRDDAVAPIILVDGDVVNCPISLSGIATTPFSGRGYRGVVALGAKPVARLYARGLLVREASSLEEILPRRAASSTEPLPGLFLRVAVDADMLEVLLDRQSVVETPLLERVIAHATKVSGALRNSVLNEIAPLPFFPRLKQRAVAARVPLLIASVFIVGLSVGAVVEVPFASKTRAWLGVPSPSGQATSKPRSIDASTWATSSITIDEPSAPTDPGWDFFYSGPKDALFSLRTRSLFNADGVPTSAPLRAAGNATLIDDGRFPIDIVTVAHGPGLVVLPTTPGHRVVDKSVFVDDTLVDTVMRSTDDEPLVELNAGPHELRYRTRFDDRPRADVSPAATPALSQAVEKILLENAAMRDPREAVERLGDVVKQQIRYSTDALDAATFAQSTRPFVDRAFVVGAGDCDVQNGVLAVMLNRAKIPARLVIGFAGSDGRVAHDLHAWAEVFLDRQWVVVDVTPRRPTVKAAGPTTAARPTRDKAPSAWSNAGAPVDTKTAISGAADDDTGWDFDDARIPLLTMLGFLVFALVGILVWLLRRSTTKGRQQAAIDPTIAEALVRRALRPAHAGDPFDLRVRNLFPLQSGARTSLATIERARLDGHCYIASGAGVVDDLSLERGLILDAASPVNARLAHLLPGIINLDRVAMALEHKDVPAVVRAVESAMRQFSDDIELRITSGRAVDETILKTKGGFRRIILVGKDGVPSRDALEKSHADPQRTFDLAAHILHRSSILLDHEDAILGQLAMVVLK